MDATRAVVPSHPPQMPPDAAIERILSELSCNVDLCLGAIATIAGEAAQATYGNQSLEWSYYLDTARTTVYAELTWYLTLLHERLADVRRAV